MSKENRKKVVITNIQRMCMSDGPGIRTTVFFKGCNLHCPWCANPENILFEKQQYLKAGGAMGIYGRDYTEEELLKEVVRDQKFWGLSGGVTFSGGEPLLQLVYLEKLLERLKEMQIHLAVETALHIPHEYLELVVKYIDLFIVDIKILDSNKVGVTGGNLECYMENIKFLKRQQKEILFRIPCNKEYTVSPNNLSKIIEFMSGFSGYPVEIFGVHSLGKSKYKSLGMDYTEFEPLGREELERIRDKLRENGNKVSINEI